MTADEIKARVRHWYATTTPDEQVEMWRKQRESWMRAFAPCEHGDPDWETCPKCLQIHRHLSAHPNTEAR